MTYATSITALLGCMRATRTSHCITPWDLIVACCLLYTSKSGIHKICPVPKCEKVRLFNVLNS